MDIDSTQKIFWIIQEETIPDHVLKVDDNASVCEINLSLPFMMDGKNVVDKNGNIIYEAVEI